MSTIVMADPGTFGSRLRFFREQVGYTQTELAEMTGVTLLTISRYENDQRVPGWDFVMKVAEVLDKTPNDFMPPPEGDPPARPVGKRK